MYKIENYNPENITLTTEQVATAYIYVEPDSQFFTDLNQVIAYIQVAQATDINWIEYLLTGLKNSLLHGYNLRNE